MHEKQAVAQAALAEIKPDYVVGIGTGSTVDCLIDLLPTIETPKWFVSSSVRTTQKLLANGFEVKSLNEVGTLDVYIDGADQVMANKIALKGGGGAHTLEKLMAVNAKQFIGMVSGDKVVTTFDFPIVLEVLKEARSYVSRQVVALGATPRLQSQTTDLGNQLVHVTQLDLTDPEAVENTLRRIVGVVEVGLFANRRFDKVYVSNNQEIECLV